MRSRSWIVAFATLAAACSGGGSTESSGPTSTRPPEITATTATTSTAPAQRAVAFPAQPAGVPFPTDEWPEGAWPSAVDKAVIDSAARVALGDGRGPRVRAVVIVHRGELVYERYGPNNVDDASAVMPGFSMAKSFTSALIGILVRDGRITADAPAVVPEWDTDGDPRAAITITDLLQMASGLEWYEDPGRVSDLSAMLASPDTAAFAAAKPMTSAPGTTFLYNTGNTQILDRIMAEEVGTDDEFRDFMEGELLDKIRIARLGTEFDRVGTWMGGVTADTTARNYAKFGLLYLRDGVWDGERILPEGWVEYSRTPSPANPEYGAGWWLDLARPGVFYAVGIKGQVIAVAPAYDLTFVQLATDGAVSLPLSEAILDAFAHAQP